MRPSWIAAALLLALLPSCGSERKRQYELEREALARKVGEIQSAQLELLGPTHRGSVQDLHERHETYVDMQAEDIEKIRADIVAISHLLKVRDEVERVQGLKWRKP